MNAAQVCINAACILYSRVWVTGCFSFSGPNLQQSAHGFMGGLFFSEDFSMVITWSCAVKMLQIL